jgi:hypothetical protein
MLKKCMMAAALALVLTPAVAHADWLFTPHLGTSFGGSSAGNFTYGATIGWMGAGIVGWETELAFTPDIIDVEDNLDFDNDDVDILDDKATTLMFNAIVGVPFGGTSDSGFRPFFSGGLGWFRARIESDEFLFDEDTDKFGFNLGGGAMGYFGNVGIRGDVRYYQTLSDENFSDVLNLEIGDYSYWRGTVGVTFRW